MLEFSPLLAERLLGNEGQWKGKMSKSEMMELKVHTKEMIKSVEIQYKNSSSEKINHLSVDDLFKLISELNSNKYGLIIEDDKEWEMFSVVKADKEYLCFYFDGDEKYLVNPDVNVDDEKEVFIGHLTERPMMFFCNKEQVFDAIDEFYSDKKNDNKTLWSIW